MKTILASLAHIDRINEVLEAAIHIAQQNDSHIIGYYPIPRASLAIYAYPLGDYPVDDVLKQFYEKNSLSVKQKFEDQMRRAGVKYEWRKDHRCEPRLVKGILEHGREADLIILAHDEAGSKSAKQETPFIADVLMAAGRPVLIVPPAKNAPFGADKIAIGWNASREACRATYDSLPLLVNASDVVLAWINPERKPDKAGMLPGAQLAAALARHGVPVTAKGISNRSRTGRAIINMVKEHDIDLLVLGAYGHARLREQILGGVTEHVLKNLPCPILLSN
ncbi:MAG: universal stress protein [Litorimonas sp.]